jgi:hypothetical protein
MIALHFPDTSALLAIAAGLAGYLVPTAKTVTRFYARAALTAKGLPLLFSKGTSTMTYQEGIAASEKVAGTIGFCVGLVEQLMPGADKATKRAALVEFIDHELTIGEKALGLPAEAIAFTTDPARVGWVLDRLEALALVPAAAPPAYAEQPNQAEAAPVAYVDNVPDGSAAGT